MFLLFFFTYIDRKQILKGRLKMKKILLLFVIMIVLLSGCGYEKSGYLFDPFTQEFTYTDKKVDATITNIEVVHWVSTCQRWNYENSVEYDGITSKYSGHADGIFEKPRFINKKIGDTTPVIIRTLYDNGTLWDKYIMTILK